MSRPSPLPFTVLVHDLENYSDGGYQRHARLQAGQRDVLDEACRVADMERERWTRQFGGDGELALIPADLPKARIIDRLIPELVTSIAEFNRDRSDDYRLRMRVAIDHGEVFVQDTGFPGDPVIAASRLCDSQPAKHALKTAPRDLAVIVSSRFYDDVVRDGPPGVDPHLFRKVRVEVKTFESDAWILVPGLVGGGSPPAPNQTPGPEPAPNGSPDGAHQRETIRIGSMENSGAFSIGGSAGQMNVGRETPR